MRRSVESVVKVKVEQPEGADSASGSSVGAALRAERLRLGQAIGDIAEQLRIRQAYLVAIEEGRFGDLPGSTYAAGFVRSYAEYLGLDAGEIGMRFKQETAGGLDNRTELVFPSPVSEGRIPGGAVLFLGLVLAGMAYGAWYYLSTRDTSIADLVPALPERLRTLVGDSSGDAAPGGDSTRTPSGTKVDEVVPPAEHDDNNQAQSSSAVPPAAAPTPVAATATPTPVAPPTPAAVQPAPVVVASPAPAPAAEPSPAPAAAPPAPAAAAPSPAPAPVDTPSSVETAATASAPAPDPAPAAPTVPAAVSPPPAPPEVAATPGEGARIYGQNNADSRITLRAVEDSWIQVRDGDQLLLTRLMRKGDSYRVPNRPGLTLMTGSAGGLEVTVDGKVIPPLGAVGVVRRDIALDPDTLSGGR